MSLEPICENILVVFSDDPDALDDFNKGLATFHDIYLDLEVPGIFQSYLPIPDGLSKDEAIDWCSENWGSLWHDSDMVPNYMFGDRETEDYNEPYPDETFVDMFRSIRYSFTSYARPPVEGVLNLSARFPHLEFLITWDSPMITTLGAARYINGEAVGVNSFDGENYPELGYDPEIHRSNNDKNSVYNMWYQRRLSRIHECLMTVLFSGDEPVSKPVRNSDENVIAEIANGKCSATIVTVPDSVMSGRDTVEVFPTLDPWRVVVGVSERWYVRTMREAKVNPSEPIDSQRQNVAKAISTIVSKSTTTASDYFQAKGLLD